MGKHDPTDIGEVEVWPDDDLEVPLTKDELAREVLDGAELADYQRKKHNRW